MRAFDYQHLVPKHAIQQLASAGDTRGEAMSRCAAFFARRGFAPVAGLIHPLDLATLRCHYRRLIRTGKMRLGDEQSPRRYVAHNDPLARFFHFNLTRVVTELAGQAVKPSYVYAAAYQEGASLEKHTDRIQCEFSLTLCVDYAPEPARETPWPIHLDTREGVVTVFQALGDALLYRGCELPHYRKALRPGHCSTSLFFHFVREDFQGPLN
jgi:hypothetical protein